MRVGIIGGGLMGREAASAFVQALRELNHDLGVPATLRSLNIQPHELEGLVDGAAKVTRLLDNNPRPLSRDDMRALYAALI